MNKNKTKMIDIADLDTGAASDKGAEIELRHPTSNAKLGMFIGILGKDSEVFREHLKHRANEQLRKEHSAQQGGRKVDAPTAEEAEDKGIELLVLCTTGWRSEYVEEVDGKKTAKNEPCLFYKGEMLAFNVPNVMRVYKEQLWIRRQVDDGVADLENFIPG